MSTQLEQIAAKAKADRALRFTSLAHLLTPEFLIETWRQMNRRGASGVDGETTTEFERELETRVQDIYARLKARTYQAPPVRRVEIPKGPGKVGTRPLGIHGRRPTGSACGRTHSGSSVRSGLSGLLVWISAGTQPASSVAYLESHTGYQESAAPL